MSINPMTWFGRKSNNVGSSTIIGARQALGVFQDTLGTFHPRKVNPAFYEALRECIGPLDGAIEKTVTLDGIIGVEGKNDALTQLIQAELIDNIPVNDMGAGLQMFYAGCGAEMYEQGLYIGEKVFDRRGRELIGLRVADSKGVAFNRDDSGRLNTWYRPVIPKREGRRDGTDAVEALLRNGNYSGDLASFLNQWGYVRMAPESIVYGARSPENDGPYGVSLLRGIEFVSQMLLQIQNATGQVWARFGDPVFHVNYKTKNRSLKGPDLDARRQVLGDNLAAALDAKRRGNSADFITAVASDDEISVDILGASKQALTIEMPARHMMEQILAKVDLPAWMLGMQWSTAERMADQQSEMVLQAAKVRFESRLPGLNDVVATWLRGRGKTWKPGDWKLVQRLPNLRDELKRAQAGFLRAQTQMMLGGNGGGTPAANHSETEGDSIENDPAPGASGARGLRGFRMEADGGMTFLFHGKRDSHPPCMHKAADVGEPWAESDPALPKLERAAEAALQKQWDDLKRKTLDALGLPAEGKSTKASATWTFDALNMLQALMDLQRGMIVSATATDGAFLQSAFAAWVRGVENAAADVDRAAQAQQVIADARQHATQGIHSRGLNYVTDATVRSYENDIVAELSAGAYDGTNPNEVAGALSKRFAAHDYDFRRLARSEIADAQAQGKLDSFREMGFEKYDFITASGACPICVDLHDQGPYVIGAGPMPMRDSHPNCRCSVRVHMDA